MQTNTYQAAVVTDHLKTYPLFTYVCGQMEWTATRSGKHAVVGYNGHGDQFLNHPASGFRFIVDEIACSQKTSASGIRQILTAPGNGAFNPGGGTGVGGTPCLDFVTCQTFITRYEEPVFRNRLMEADRKISPCPLTILQATRDYRFIKQPNTNCYISVLSEGVTSQPNFCLGADFNPFTRRNPVGPSYSFTRQCCYYMG